MDLWTGADQTIDMSWLHLLKWNCRRFKSYLDAVVSRFGLKTEWPLGIRLDDPAERLHLTPVAQSDFVATLLLHAFRQTTDGDLTTDTEPGGWNSTITVIDRNKTIEKSCPVLHSCLQSKGQTGEKASWGKRRINRSRRDTTRDRQELDNKAKHDMMR